MLIEMTAIEARVVGCLMEKAITTPDQYPLSLNALTNACNQKSNRDPVMDLSEAEVQQTLEALVSKHLIIERSGFGSRVPKYQHRLCNTTFGSLEFTPLQTAILCELLLRGPQTPGELRTRTARMAPAATTDEVEVALNALMQRAEGPFVMRLPREPSRRDARYMHLFSGSIPQVEQMPTEVENANAPRVSLQERVERLEQQVNTLQQAIADLQQRAAPSPTDG